MKSPGDNNRARSIRTWAKAAMFLVLGLPLPASGVLGANTDSVQNDQVYLQADVRIVGGEMYVIHELRTPTGIVVREYVSPDQQVFAATWRSPFIPDLKQLLGGYFDQYLQAVKKLRQGQVGHSSLNIRQSDIVFQASGHMRPYFGRAYDPSLVPAGVGADALR